VSGKVIPLKRPPAASPELPGPWIPGETFTRAGVDYEIVTAGEIKVVEAGDGKKASAKAPYVVLDLLRDAGALVGDHVLILRRTRPA